MSRNTNHVDNNNMNDTFEKKVDRCKRKELSDIIENASRDHAKYLVKALLDKAIKKNEPIRIVTGTFDGDFYKGLVDAFSACTEKNIPISVIVLDKEFNPASHPMAKLIDSGNIRLLTIADDKIEEASTAPHFILVGDRRFRLETDHDQAKAVASFNDPSMGRWLMETFNWLVDASNKTQEDNHRECVAAA